MSEKNLEKKHYWCVNCHIPLINKFCLNCGEPGKEIVSDIKPVFHFEYKYYLEALKNNQNFNETFFPRILYRYRNQLISDVAKGNTHFKIKVLSNISDNENSLLNIGEFAINLQDINLIYGRSKINEFFLESPKYLETLINGNLIYLKNIEKEAINFIKKISDKYESYHKIVSFSGGKDSTVTAHLVKQAIGNVDIVFSDTGIEYPETIEYVKKYGNTFGNLIFLESEVNFLELCQKLGPPSRTMRWCCFTNKGTPFSKFYANCEYKNVLSFDGIRKNESHLRSNYLREQDNTKYEKQYSAYPILNWTTLEVWLYILWKKLPYNKLYDHGFSRIGCWACPNNNRFDWFLFSKVHPEMVKKWFSFINNYKHQQAQKIEKENPEITNKTKYALEWTEDGHWKSRRVKYHNENNLLKLESPCGKHDFDLYLKHEIPKNLIEFLKVFGKIEVSTLPDNKTFFRIISKDIIISFIEKGNLIKFYIEDERKTEKLKKLLFRQINKSFNCIDCGACMGSCPQGAISINPHFHIDEKKCKNCLICASTKYIKMSCIALHYKEKRILLSLK